MARIGIMQVVVAAVAAFAGMAAMAEVKDGTRFRLGTVPKELVAERRMGEPVRFSLEENASTGFKWDVESNTNECTVALRHRGGDKGATCGAPGLLEVTVTSRVRTPVRVVFRYRRPWEKDMEPWKTLQLVVNTISAESNRAAHADTAASTRSRVRRCLSGVIPEGRTGGTRALSGRD